MPQARAPLSLPKEFTFTGLVCGSRIFHDVGKIPLGFVFLDLLVSDGFAHD